MSNADIREVTKIVTAHHQREGAGFVVRRPVPSARLRWRNPFLLLDEMGPSEYAPGEAVGAPTTRIAVSKPSLHARRRVRARGLRGPPRADPAGRRAMDDGRRRHRPLRDAFAPNRRGRGPRPRLPDLGEPARAAEDDAASLPGGPGERHPRSPTDDGLASVRVIAGQRRAPSGDRHAHPDRLSGLDRPGRSRRTAPRPPGPRCSGVRVRRRRAIGNGGRELRDGQLAVLGTAAGPAPRGPDASTRAPVVLAGPLFRAVAHYGPFVMSTKRELMEAIGTTKAAAWARSPAAPKFVEPHFASAAQRKPIPCERVSGVVFQR